MLEKFAKKIIFLGISIVSFIPLFTFVSCANTKNNLENQILDLELKKDVKLKINPIISQDIKLGKINLLNIGENNEQLLNIFEIPEPRKAETNNNYTISYSWDFTKKNIVSFDQHGNISFELNVNVFENNNANNLSSYVTKNKTFNIFTENTTIIEETSNFPDNNQANNVNSVNKPAVRYVYHGIDANNIAKKFAFQAVRNDVFQEIKNFNFNFYGLNSIINNRPVIIDPEASKESAIDAYSKQLISNPPSTSYNDSKYIFSINEADFSESNSEKGIYKIRVSPEFNDIFDNDFINYAKNEYKISFDKYYYYYEKNINFQKPTESNISTHNAINSKKATDISQVIANTELGYLPIVKDLKLIIGKNAEEIVELNRTTPGGLFSPPLYKQNYSIEPPKPVFIDINSVAATDPKNLNFSMIIKVGNTIYQQSITVTKKVDIKYLF